ncbi:MAG: diguanylate cyclase [Bacillota bacterium]|jgi:diguanylate cyclase (GGDEF)-like protein
MGEQSIFVPWVAALSLLILLLVLCYRYRAKTGEVAALQKVYQALMDADDRLIYIKTADQRYRLVNRALERAIGKSRSELLGQEATSVLAADWANHDKASDLETLASGSVLVAEQQIKDRTFRAIKLPLELPGLGPAVGAVVQDITEERIRRQREQKTLLRYSILIDVFSQQFESTREQLDFVLSKAVEMTESRFGYIFFYDEATEEFEVNTWSAETLAECRIDSVPSMNALSQIGLWGEVVRQRRPLIINDYESHADWKKGYPEGHIPLKRFMSIPVVINDEIVAVVGLANKAAPYDTDDVQQLTLLMTGVWTAKEKREQQIELQQAYEALAQHEEELLYLSYHDSLTGLYNRRFFEAELLRQNQTIPVSMLVADMNGLKLTNDVFGHAAGDLLLIKAASVLRRVCGEQAVIARTGGDEFAIILSGTDLEEARRLAAQIQEEFAKEQVKAVRGSISIGSASKSTTDQDLAAVYDCAERRMYLQKTMEREAINRGLIETIISSLHEKSVGEKEHSELVSRLCQRLGEAMNLPERELRRLRELGYLHDIGKVVLDDHLLGPSEDLDDESKQEARRHVIAGYRILKLFDETVDLADAVFYHHENWDGSGYPRGLRGEAIPWLARAVAVVGVFSRRIRPPGGTEPMSEEEALREIESQSGTRFDPEIVAAFARMMRGQ